MQRIFQLAKNMASYDYNKLLRAATTPAPAPMGTPAPATANSPYGFFPGLSDAVVREAGFNRSLTPLSNNPPQQAVYTGAGGLTNKDIGFLPNTHPADFNPNANWNNGLSTRRGGAPSSTPAVAPTPSSGNVTATSVGSGSPFGISPQLTPALQEQMMQLMGQYTPLLGGGYIHADIPDSPLHKGGSPYKGNITNMGSDPNANRVMANFYQQVGNQPTVANTSPALAQLNQATGVQPRQGPSFNEILAKLLAGPTGPLAKKAGFGPTYTGPWGIPGY
jgi:hypothetical protein